MPRRRLQKILASHNKARPLLTMNQTVVTLKKPPRINTSKAQVSVVSLRQVLEGSATSRATYDRLNVIAKKIIRYTTPSSEKGELTPNG